MKEFGSYKLNFIIQIFRIYYCLECEYNYVRFLKMVEPFAIQSRVLSLDTEGLRYDVIKDEMLVTSMSSFSHNIFCP